MPSSPRRASSGETIDPKFERCLIDANWGSSTDVVCQFCRQSAHAGIVLPSHGRFVGASSQPFTEYKRRPGDRIGHNWRMPHVHDKRAVRHVVFDTNFWKSFVFARLAFFRWLARSVVALESHRWPTNSTTRFAKTLKDRRGPLATPAKKDHSVVS